LSLSRQLQSVRAILPAPTITSFAPDSLSAGGGSLTIAGAKLSSLPLLSGGTLQCRWNGDATGTWSSDAFLLSSTQATCALPAMPRTVALLRLQLALFNESIAVGVVGQLR
jgi:hypothetical protein